MDDGRSDSSLFFRFSFRRAREDAASGGQTKKMIRDRDTSYRFTQRFLHRTLFCAAHDDGAGALFRVKLAVFKACDGVLHRMMLIRRHD